MTDLRGVPHLAILGAVAALCLGVPILLFLLLTRGRRRAANEIRNGCALEGWRYRGRSEGFQIDGATRGAVPWEMTGVSGFETERRWNAELNLRFRTLRGETDLAVTQRDGEPLPSALPPSIEARIARFSGTLAGASKFLRESHEAPAGMAEFDARYDVRATHAALATVNAALARRILNWPPDAVAPYSVLAWRDPFGFHFHVRLPVEPNWITVAWLARLGEEFAARLPAVAAPPVPSGWIDRILAAFQ